eukprot:jgi/Botrbrau1/19325/Bobra.0073s0056.1
MTSMTWLEPKAGTKLSTYIVADMPDNVPMVVESHQSGRISVRRGSGSLDLPHSETPAVPIVNVAKWKYPAGADEGMNNAGIGRAGSVASSVTDLPVLPWSDWHIEPSDLQICTHPDGTQWKLGSGGYGSVYKALLDGVQEVAVKVFHDVHSIVEEADILREVAILKGCRDRNIVQFYGACRDPASGRILLVTEYMEAGDLYHALNQNCPTNLCYLGTIGANALRWRLLEVSTTCMPRGLCILTSNLQMSSSHGTELPKFPTLVLRI